MKKANAGFTLVELMVVVVIVGILASVAYPSYVEYVNKGRRAECKSAILQTANLLERYYTVNNKYVANFNDIGGRNFSGNSAASSACSLAIAPEAAGGVQDDGFRITGTPNIADAKCGNLTFTHKGVKGESGSETADYCWR